MANWFTNIVNKVRAPDPYRGYSAWIPMPSLPDGFRLTNEQSLQVGAVFACVRLIAETVAAMPVNVVSVDPKGKKAKQTQDPLAYMLNIRPNGYSTAQSFKESLVSSALLHESGYAEIVRDTGGRAVELRFMFAERTSPTTTSGELVYRYTDLDGTQKDLPAGDVLHIRGLSLDSLTGTSIVAVAARSIAIASAQDRYAASYFANSAVPSGLLTTPVGKKLTEEDRKALVESIRKRAGGAQQHAPLVLENGATWTPLSHEPEKAQLVESRALSVEDIARWFGVPLPLLQVHSASQGYGTNLQQLFLGWVLVGLAPWVKRWEQELTIKLAPRGPRYFQLDSSHLTRGTATDIATADDIAIKSGVRSVNECRDAAGLDGIGSEGDLHMVSNALVVLDEGNLTKPEPQRPVSPDAETPAEESDTTEEEGTAEMKDAVVANLLARIESRVTARVKNLQANGLKAEDIASNVAADVRRQLFGSN